MQHIIAHISLLYSLIIALQIEGDEILDFWREGNSSVIAVMESMCSLELKSSDLGIY